MKNKNQSKEVLSLLEKIIDAGVCIRFNKYFDYYQSTIYPDGIRNELNHHHFEGDTLEEVIFKAYSFVEKKLENKK